MSTSRTIIVTFPEAETSHILVSYLSKEKKEEKEKEVISSEELLVLPSLPLPSSALSTLTALPVPSNTQARAILFASPHIVQVMINHNNLNGPHLIRKSLGKNAFQCYPPPCNI